MPAVFCLVNYTHLLPCWTTLVCILGARYTSTPAYLPHSYSPFFPKGLVLKYSCREGGRWEVRRREGRKKRYNLWLSKTYILNMIGFHTDALTLCRACNTSSVTLAQLVWSLDSEVPQWWSHCHDWKHTTTTKQWLVSSLHTTHNIMIICFSTTVFSSLPPPNLIQVMANHISQPQSQLQSYWVDLALNASAIPPRISCVALQLALETAIWWYHNITCVCTSTSVSCNWANPMHSSHTQRTFVLWHLTMCVVRSSSLICSHTSWHIIYY